MQDVSQHLRSSFFILKALRGRLAREIFAGALGWKTCLGGLETLRGRLAPRKPLLSNDMEIGGKTGTSNKNRDAWFMCVAPKLVAGAWVGGEALTF